VLCVCSGCEGQGTTQYPLEVGVEVDSLDMSWLPLSRFESRAACVAVCGLGARDEGATPDTRWK
jgi:hypothetical protein